VNQETIRYSIEPSPLGLLLVAMTDHGVCAVYLSDARDDLMAALESSFPAADFTQDADSTRAAVTAICAYLNGESSELNLALDSRGTDFQRRVWQELRQIPYGETRSYRDVAVALGKPGAVRAVGAACGANQIALAIPCHRVARTDGKLTGFRWGIERKKALLKLESQPRP
jgi:AraC family transcriptional regulator of adaptative response/methylated-DNA-[protein]-cysteine methyltransferase